MNSRKYVYVFPSAYGTTNVINYDAQNSNVNTFLCHFDMWGNNGLFKKTESQETEVWFECFPDFISICKKESIQRAFRNMGVELVFDSPI